MPPCTDKVAPNSRAGSLALRCLIVKNRLAKELLVEQSPTVPLRQTCFSGQARLFFTSSTSGLRERPELVSLASYAQT